MFQCAIVTKGAQLDQFDWPRTLRSQVSIYNIDNPLLTSTTLANKDTDNLCTVFTRILGAREARGGKAIRAIERRIELLSRDSGYLHVSVTSLVSLIVHLKGRSILICYV